MNPVVMVLELTKEQLDGLLELLDTHLKLNGVTGLPKSVELFNVLSSAKPKPEETE